MTNRDNTAVWEAQLRDMPPSMIVNWLRTQGHADLARLLHGRITGALEEDDEEGVIMAFLGGGPDRLPPGYPPLADYDDETLPFDAEKDVIRDNVLLAECERRGWTVYWDRPSGRIRIGSVDEEQPLISSGEERRA